MLLCSSISIGQEFESDLNAIMLRDNGIWSKNSQVNIKKFAYGKIIDEYGEIKDAYYLQDSEGNKVEINSKIKDCFEFKCDNIQQFWDANVVTKVLCQLKKYGFQDELRSEMESNALEYINKVKSYGLELNDPFLESYIYGLVAKITPMQLIDGRPSDVNILIQENPSINAACFPNGTIVLNTGLLAMLHSEDELVAILSHEIAHFVLDHSVQNANAAIARQKRAEFWAAVATGLTAVAEGYATAQNSYYTPGTATLSMAMLSTAIASKVIDYLGMSYNHEQEEEADKLAVEALKILGYNENALATALARMKSESTREKHNAMYVNSYTHPALVERILKVGVPFRFEDTKFEQTVSFAVSSVAMMKYSDRRFRQCLPYVNQNIENGVATADDYILKANCLLSIKDDKESYNEVLNLLNTAKQLASENINVYKTEIIATLRSGNKTLAVELLQKYVEILDYNQCQVNVSAEALDNLMSFLITEKSWAKKMIVKLNGM